MANLVLDLGMVLIVIAVCLAAGASTPLIVGICGALCVWFGA